MREIYGILFDTIWWGAKLVITGFSLFGFIIVGFFIFNKVPLPIIVGCVCLLVAFFAFWIWRFDKQAINQVEEERYNQWVESKKEMKSAEYEVVNGVRYTRIK